MVWAGQGSKMWCAECQYDYSTIYLFMIIELSKQNKEGGGIHPRPFHESGKERVWHKMYGHGGGKKEGI